jgi:hypothetical protein
LLENVYTIIDHHRNSKCNNCIFQVTEVNWDQSIIKSLIPCQFLAFGGTSDNLVPACGWVLYSDEAKISLIKTEEDLFIHLL